VRVLNKNGEDLLSLIEAEQNRRATRTEDIELAIDWFKSCKSVKAYRGCTFIAEFAKTCSCDIYYTILKALEAYQPKETQRELCETCRFQGSKDCPWEGTYHHRDDREIGVCNAWKGEHNEH
jgi:hypothetical protein